MLYYQFDQRRYLDQVGSYIDFQTDLPGSVCLTQEQVLEALEASAAAGFTLSAESKALADGWFKYKDAHNRQRTYEFLEGKGF